MGRLNVIRAPAHVMEMSYDEALSNFTDEMAVLYNMNIDEAVEYLSLHFDDVAMIDSPLQNLALLKDALDGTSVLNDHPLINNDVGTLMAIFLGSASDKTIEVTAETAYAVVKILTGEELSQSEAEKLAADAEAIRLAILAGHG